MGFILVEQTQTSVEHTKFSLLYFVEHNQTMLVEHNHTMPVEHTNVTRDYSMRKVPLGLRKNRSLTSLYDPCYDPPWDCLYENIGSNHKPYQVANIHSFFDLIFGVIIHVSSEVSCANV